MGTSAGREMVTLAFCAYSGFLESSARVVRRAVTSALDELSDLCGPHELVWGPAVHSAMGEVVDDALLMVVQPKDRPGELTVVVRGTNPVSLSSWIFQDIDVSTQVPWSATDAPVGVRVSRGNHRSLDILTSKTVPDKRAPGAGLYIGEFLKQTAASLGDRPLTLNVTGHSLGGAMAPTLALWLRQQLPWQENWTLNTHAFAGPTAGNAAFAAYSDKVMGAEPLLRYVNPLDVVPNAWDTTLMDDLPQAYRKCWDSKAFSLLVKDIVACCHDGDYRHPGTMVELDHGFKKRLPAFAAQMIYQHVFPYLDHFKLPTARILSTVGLSTALAAVNLADAVEDKVIDVLTDLFRL